MFLSGDDSEIITGNYIADFITNKELITFQDGIIEGIRLHRKIDDYTDNHPVIAGCNARLRPTQNKYAPVVTDIILDFLLSQNWDELHGKSLREYADNIYHVLQNYLHIFPDKLKQIAPRMIDDDFLLSCHNEERLIKTFHFLSRRARFDNNIQNAHKDLNTHYDAFQTDFLTFFPQVIEYFRRN